MKRLLILVAALALLTTACKVVVNADFTINSDKSGAVTIEIGMDDEVITTLTEFSEGEFDPQTLLEDFDTEDIPGATTAVEVRDGMTYIIIRAPIPDLTVSDAMASGTPVEGLSEVASITFTEDQVRVEASGDLEGLLSGGATGGEDMGDMGGMEGLSPQFLAQFFEINLRVTMPGPIIDHNADRQDGNTLTWAIDLAAPTVDLFAVSARGGPGSGPDSPDVTPATSPGAQPGGDEGNVIAPGSTDDGSSIPVWVWIVGGVLVLALLLALFQLYRNRNSQGSPPAATAGAPPPPPPSE
jgi:hypothetical protein